MSLVFLLLSFPLHFLLSCFHMCFLFLVFFLFFCGFCRYMEVFALYASDVYTPQAIQDQTNAFTKLCMSLSHCTLSDTHTCQNKYADSDWSNKPYFWFIVLVTAALAYKALLEFCKCILILIAAYQKDENILSSFYLHRWLLKSSPITPLLLRSHGWSAVQQVLQHEPNAAELFRSFLLFAMPVQGFTLALVCIFFMDILETGFNWLDFVSLVMNGILLPIGLVNAVLKWRKSQEEGSKQWFSYLSRFFLLEILFTHTHDCRCPI